jgi:hypothetical protein
MQLASVIYKSYVRPYLKKNESTIDASIANASNRLQEKAKLTLEQNAELLRKYAAQTLSRDVNAPPVPKSE